MESVLMPSCSLYMPDEPLIATGPWPTVKHALRAIGLAMGGRKALELVDRWFAMSDAGASQTQLLRYQNTNYSQAPVLRGTGGTDYYYVSLHVTPGPGHAGTQSTNETAYTNYARVGVVLTSGGWTAGGSTDPVTMSNAAAITFAQCGVTGATLHSFAFGSLTSGAGVQYIYANLGADLTVSSGVTPSFAIGAVSDALT